MAKRKDDQTAETVDVVKENKQPEMIDATFNSIFGSPVSIDPLYGVALPYFSQRMMFGSNVLPVGKTILLAGRQGSCKTSLALDFSRLFVEQPGMACAIHTENKWPDSLISGIMGDAIKRLARADQMDTTQDWEKYLTNLYMKIMADPVLKTMPLAVFVDSLQGAQEAGQMKKIQKSGHTEREFSGVARELSVYLPVLSNFVSQTFSTLFLISHLKGKEFEEYTTGGQSKDFYAGYTFFLLGASQKVDNKGTEMDGRIDFIIQNQKNSFGPKTRNVRVGMQWWFDEAMVQRFRFTWPEATADFVYDVASDSNHKTRAKEITDIFGDIKSGSGGAKGTLYSSKKLGVDRVTTREFGEAIEANPTIRKELDQFMCIQQRKTWQEELADRKNKQAAEEEARKRGRK